jgi:alpha-tubulin suppressor-like RCC1 family protein
MSNKYLDISKLSSHNKTHFPNENSP